MRIDHYKRNLTHIPNHVHITTIEAYYCSVIIYDKLYSVFSMVREAAFLLIPKAFPIKTHLFAESNIKA